MLRSTTQKAASDRRPVIAVRRGGWAVAVAFLLAATPGFGAGFLQWMFHHDVQVITSTDLTPAGALLRPASPDHPVYYVGINAGYRDLGGIVAGDKLPDPQAMIRTIARVLAEQGYLPSDNRHPATECIIFTWGTLYTEKLENPDMPPIQFNRYAIMRFLGGNKLGLTSDHPDPWLDTALMPGLTRFNPNAQAIAEISGDDLYAVALASYEFPVARPKPPKLLWRTRIACPSVGLVMSNTLPTMVTIAGPYIGRDTPAPVWVNASDKFKPQVKIGNPKVEEYIDSGHLPVYDVEKSPSKAAAGGK